MAVFVVDGAFTPAAAPPPRFVIVIVLFWLTMWSMFTYFINMYLFFVFTVEINNKKIIYNSLFCHSFLQKYPSDYN